MLTCLIAGLQKAAHKAVNYDKLREISQRPDENPAQFLSRLTETLQKYTLIIQLTSKIDPNSHEGTIVLNTRLISQSAPDIWKKFKRDKEGPQPLQRDLLSMAFKVFNNRDEQAKLDQSQRDQTRYQLLAAAIKGTQTGTRDWGLRSYPASRVNPDPVLGAARKAIGYGLAPPPTSFRVLSPMWEKGTLQGGL
ncbi:hypothetical protein mRhiFer1_008379 [Rhinolophus ferrumequinum]|uniref:Core shell protein Gag P30 domain-containing protein n=1 Tax=Rhinolophus ferrumequinum TaxID=59479 RepID=A0A7J7VE41_RHIFE|nr:hypothetical protein mRhiFer1_008379 [Rhinolophus ferrumequinum]